MKNVGSFKEEKIKIGYKRHFVENKVEIMQRVLKVQ
jgi:hypothetical protein